MGETIAERYERLKRDHGFSEDDIEQLKVIDVEYDRAVRAIQARYDEQMIADRQRRNEQTAYLITRVEKLRNVRLGDDVELAEE